MKKYASLLAVMLVAVLLLAVPAGALAATSVSTAADLKTAVEAGESVVLTGDITLTESLKVSGKTLTIDLGGNTLSMPKGDNFFQADSDITITNGTIDISNGVASGDAYINVGNYSTSSKLTLDGVTFKGTDYSSAYAVFYVRKNSTLNIKNSTVTLTNDKASSGGVIKGKFPHSVNITDGSVLNFTNAKIGILGGNVLFKDSELNVSGGANGINSSAGDNELHLTVDNSTLTLKDGKGGTGMKLRGGSSLTVKNGGSVELTGYTDADEYDLVLDATGTISIDDSSYVAYNTLKAPSDVLGSVQEDDIANLENESVANHVLAKGVTVTYTDGVSDATIFADETYTTFGGADTPAFQGETKREGYTFDGWNPALADKVNGNTTYTAQWTLNAVEDDEPETEEPEEQEPVPEDKAPVTGDNTPIAMLMALVVMAGAGMLVAGKKFAAR